MSPEAPLKNSLLIRIFERIRKQMKFFKAKYFFFRFLFYFRNYFLHLDTTHIHHLFFITKSFSVLKKKSLLKKLIWSLLPVVLPHRYIRKHFQKIPSPLLNKNLWKNPEADELFFTSGFTSFTLIPPPSSHPSAIFFLITIFNHP